MASSAGNVGVGGESAYYRRREQMRKLAAKFESGESTIDVDGRLVPVVGGDGVSFEPGITCGFLHLCEVFI